MWRCHPETYAIFFTRHWLGSWLLDYSANWCMAFDYGIPQMEQMICLQ